LPTPQHTDNNDQVYLQKDERKKEMPTPQHTGNNDRVYLQRDERK
jgi:hypothetical protein